MGGSFLCPQGVAAGARHAFPSCSGRAGARITQALKNVSGNASRPVLAPLPVASCSSPSEPPSRCSRAFIKRSLSEISCFCSSSPRSATLCAPACSVYPVFPARPSPKQSASERGLSSALQTLSFSSYALFGREVHGKSAFPQEPVSSRPQNDGYADSRTSGGIRASNIRQQSTVVDGQEILVSATPSIPGFSTIAYKGQTRLSLFPG